jgi:hypothetical protein
MRSHRVHRRRRVVVAMVAVVAAGAFGCEAILGMDAHDAL